MPPLAKGALNTDEYGDDGVYATRLMFSTLSRATSKQAFCALQYYSKSLVLVSCLKISYQLIYCLLSLALDVGSRQRNSSNLSLLRFLLVSSFRTGSFSCFATLRTVPFCATFLFTKFPTVLVHRFASLEYVLNI